MSGRPNVVTTVEEAFEFMRWLSAQKRVAFDTETIGLGLYEVPRGKPIIRLIQFGTTTDAWVVPFQQWRGLIEDVFRRFTGEWIAHNSRYDMLALLLEGIVVPWWQVDDTLIALRLAEPTKPAGLKPASERHISGASAIGQHALDEAMRKQKWTFETVPLDFEPFLYYAALDTVLTARLDDHAICREGRASPVYYLEMETRAICSEMESNGMKVNARFCGEQSQRLREMSDAIKAQIEAEYGFAPGSNQQLGHWFASQPDALALLTKETDGGGISVAKDVLIELMMVPGPVGTVATDVLTQRRCDKLAGTYLEGFLEKRDYQDRVHCQIETIAARTGRMSIKDIPLQTLPKPTIDSDYRIVREAVVPLQDDHVIVSADYDQIEMRLTAHISKDPGLVEAFRFADSSGVDFFTQLAQGVYKDPTIDKNDKRRSRIKTFSYASLYGASVKKMAWSAGIPVAEMKDVRDDLAGRYPGFFRVMHEVAHEVNLNGGYVETEYGRRLPIDTGKAYVATNYKIQGTAADVLKRALVNLGQAGFGPYMLAPVHDEVVFSLPAEDADEMRAEIARNMACFDFEVPLTCDPSPGVETWAHAK